jgi:hypothetical protein
MYGSHKCDESSKLMVKKGFEYQDCTLCNATGTISDVLDEDYLLLNEDLLET